LGLNTIKRAEGLDGKTSLTAANELAIRRACEAAGVEFTNGDQPGVRLTKAAAVRSVEPGGSSGPAGGLNTPRRKITRANPGKR